MMFRLFEIIADRIREQAAEYAGAQARIGARALAHVTDPFGMMPARIARLPVPAPEPAPGARPRLPSSERRGRRSSHPTDKRRQRQCRRPASSLA